MLLSLVCSLTLAAQNAEENTKITILDNKKDYSELPNNRVSVSNQTLQVVQRYGNDSVKKAGKFGDDCLGKEHRKHGSFISFNKKGKIKKVRYYFFDQRRNAYILGLKHGCWGFYGINDRYFLGIKLKMSRIVDPCF